MTQLLLKRKIRTSEAIIGDLTVNGVFECFILENKHKAIEAGKYLVTLTYSPRFKRFLPLINGVPNRMGIRLHAANYPEELEGCLAPGTHHENDFVGNSRAAMQALYTKLQRETGEIWITVVD